MWQEYTEELYKKALNDPENNDGVVIHLRLNILKCKVKWALGNNQIRSVDQSCPTLCYPMNCSMPGLPVHHQLLDFTQTHIH